MEEPRKRKRLFRAFCSAFSKKHSELCLYIGGQVNFWVFKKEPRLGTLRAGLKSDGSWGGVSHSRPTHQRRKTRRNERGLDLLQLGKHFKDHFIINRLNRNSNKHLSMIDLCRMTGLPKIPPKKPQNAPKNLNKVNATYYKMAPPKAAIFVTHTYIRTYEMWSKKCPRPLLPHPP